MKYQVMAPVTATGVFEVEADGSADAIRKLATAEPVNMIELRVDVDGATSPVPMGGPPPSEPNAPNAGPPFGLGVAMGCQDCYAQNAPEDTPREGVQHVVADSEGDTVYVPCPAGRAWRHFWATSG